MKGTCHRNISWIPQIDKQQNSKCRQLVNSHVLLNVISINICIVCWNLHNWECDKHYYILFVEIMSCGSLKNCLSHLQDITIYIPVERVIKHILKGQTFHINYCELLIFWSQHIDCMIRQVGSVAGPWDHLHFLFVTAR